MKNIWSSVLGPVKNLCLFFLLSLVLASPALAFDGRWLVGLDALSSFVGEDDDSDQVVIDEQAGGVALQFGYLLSDAFLLRVYGSGALHHTSAADVDIRLNGATIEAAYHFRPGQSLRPYIFGGLGGFTGESQLGDFKWKTEGPGLTFGLGAHLRLGGRFTLHGSLRAEAINWDKVTASYESEGGTVSAETPVDESGMASKLTLGVGFWL